MFCISCWEANWQVFVAVRHSFLGAKPLTDLKNLFCAVTGMFSPCICFLPPIEMEVEGWLNRHVKLIINGSRGLASLFEVMSELEEFPVT